MTSNTGFVISEIIILKAGVLLLRPVVENIHLCRDKKFMSFVNPSQLQDTLTALLFPLPGSPSAVRQF
jgi:hypothetical protein